MPTTGFVGGGVGTFAWGTVDGPSDSEDKVTQGLWPDLQPPDYPEVFVEDLPQFGDEYAYPFYDPFYTSRYRHIDRGPVTGYSFSIPTTKRYGSEGHGVSFTTPEDLGVNQVRWKFRLTNALDRSRRYYHQVRETYRYHVMLPLSGLWTNIITDSDVALGWEEQDEALVQEYLQFDFFLGTPDSDMGLAFVWVGDAEWEVTARNTVAGDTATQTLALDADTWFILACYVDEDGVDHFDLHLADGDELGTLITSFTKARSDEFSKFDYFEFYVEGNLWDADWAVEFDWFYVQLWDPEALPEEPVAPEFSVAMGTVG